MKRILFAMVVVFLMASTVGAQNPETTDVVPTQAPSTKLYVPQAGDIGLSVDLLSPVMDYLGNMFNNNTNNTFPTTFSGPDYTGNVSVAGRYFIYDNLALRASLSVNNAINISEAYSQDDAALAADPLSVSLVKDAKNNTTNDLYLSLGLEIRRGYKRIQGFYGLQLIGGYQSLTTSYTYGNAITSLNQNPSQSFASTPLSNVGGNSRLLKTNTAQGRNFIIGLGAFIGVEYFILPKLALGGEVALSALGIFSGQQYEDSERYNPSSGVVEQNTRLSSPGGTTWVLNTQNYGNGLYVAFYF